MSGLSGQAAIAGIGATEFSKASGRSELQLACEAVNAALTDAGIAAPEVDGLVTYTMDTNPEIMCSLDGLSDDGSRGALARFNLNGH